MYQNRIPHSTPSTALPQTDNVFLRKNYDGAELRTNPPHTGSDVAAKLPSRFGDSLIAPTGVLSLNSNVAVASAASNDEPHKESDV